MKIIKSAMILIDLFRLNINKVVKQD